MRKIVLALALLISGSAWGQVGQIATFPPKAVVIGGGGGITLVVSAAAGSVDGSHEIAVTAPKDTSTATLLVVMVSRCGVCAGAGTLTDNKGNVWTEIGTGWPSTSITAEMFYCCASGSPTVGSGHTFTYTSLGANYPAIAVGAFSGTATNPFDASSPQTSGNATQPGNLTSTVNNELFVAGFAYGGTTGSPSLSINSGFTITDKVDLTTGLNEGVAMAYKVQPTVATLNPTWGSVASEDYAPLMSDYIP